MFPESLCSLDLNTGFREVTIHKMSWVFWQPVGQSFPLLHAPKPFLLCVSDAADLPLCPPDWPCFAAPFSTLANHFRDLAEGKKSFSALSRVSQALSSPSSDCQPFAAETVHFVEQFRDPETHKGLQCFFQQNTKPFTPAPYQRKEWLAVARWLDHPPQG